MSPRSRLVLLWAGFAALALFVYEPALQGQFVSDDLVVLSGNPYVQSLDAKNLAAIVDPRGEPARNTANWAPIHLLAHALEWQAFGREVTGYHLVNVVLHALASTLLVALLLARGLVFPPAAGVGLIFLLHPANVEAVAWIFQLKTVGALALALGALLLQPRRPALALLCFGAALLTKASALAALPAAAVFAWTARDPEDGWRRNARWLWAWALLLLVYAVPQLLVFKSMGEHSEPLAADAATQVRSMFAIGGRYLWMAASGMGVSTYQEPALARSWLDPWWLGGLAATGILASRVARSLRERREEAAWWVFAAASYAPVSQIFPFLYPMADRYLYFVLPGLLGAVLFALREPIRAWRAAAARRGRGHAVELVLGLALGALLVDFALCSRARARVWRTSHTIVADAAANHPEGRWSQVIRAQKAAQAGDAAATVAALRAAGDLGKPFFLELLSEPVYLKVRADEAFHRHIQERAAAWVARRARWTRPTQAQLRLLASAYGVLERTEEAIAALEQALVQGGPFDAAIRVELVGYRARLRREAAD